MNHLDTENNILERAIILATQAHLGQVDKDGFPHILHSLRVMAEVSSIEEKIVAVLHDVIEDTNMSGDDLIAAGIPDKYVKSVEIVSRDRENETYKEFIHRINNSGNVTAIRVKIADLICNLGRLHTLKDIDEANGLSRRYINALRILGINHGEDYL